MFTELSDVVLRVHDTRYWPVAVTLDEPPTIDEDFTAVGVLAST
jgi:hypothetical protein